MSTNSHTHHNVESLPAVDHQTRSAVKYQRAGNDYPLARRPTRIRGNRVGDSRNAEAYTREEWVQLRLDADFPWSGA